MSWAVLGCPGPVGLGIRFDFLDPFKCIMGTCSSNVLRSVWPLCWISCLTNVGSVAESILEPILKLHGVQSVFLFDSLLESIWALLETLLALEGLPRDPKL